MNITSTKRRISAGLAIMLLLCLIFATSVSAQSTDYRSSTHPNILQYKGYAQFVPSYVVPASAGYGLVKDKNVKQGYFYYTIGSGGEYLGSGRYYTSAASAKTSYNTYWVSKTVNDTLNPFAAKTVFSGGWAYF
jgi:hypothetical protein